MKEVILKQSLIEKIKNFFKLRNTITVEDELRNAGINIDNWTILSNLGWIHGVSSNDHLKFNDLFSKYFPDYRGDEFPGCFSIYRKYVMLKNKIEKYDK